MSGAELFVIELGAAVLGAVFGAVLGAPLASRAARDGRGMTGWRHPAAGAALGAVAFAAMAFSIGVGPMLAPALVFAAAATVLTMTDAAERRIPHVILGPSLAGVAGLLVVASLLDGVPERLLGALLGSVAYFATLLLIAVVSPAGMGMGDVKLATLTGMMLGTGGATTWLIGVVAATVLGGVAAVVALALRRVELSGSIPFGPAMLAGTMVGLALSA